MDANNKVMECFEKWLLYKCKISLSPTASRWGFIGILTSGALFFLSLFASMLAIHLSSNWGNLKPLTWKFWVAIGLLIIGLSVLIFAIGLAKYLIVRHKDTTTKDIKYIKKNTKKIIASLKKDE